MVDKRKGVRNFVKPLAILFILSVAMWYTSLTMYVRAAPPIMTTFKVEPEIIVARVGETVTVAINAYDIDEFWGWQVIWYWDYTVLDYIGYTFGGLLSDQPEGSTQTVDAALADSGILLCTELTFQDHPGITADFGWLISVEFEVLRDAGTSIDIDDPVTFWFQDAITVWGDDEGEMIKEGGDFMPPWPEDIHVDGFIDALDLANVALDWGTYVVQTKDPSTYTGDWSTAYFASDSDNLYASAGTDGATEIYGNYGFETSGWTTVSKVEVGLEAHEAAGGNDNVEVSVSNNGGSAWSSVTSAEDIEPGETDEFIWIDMTGKFSWTPSMLTDANFKVRIVHDKDGGSAETIYVDWLPVRVTPTPTSRNPYSDVNGDGAVDIADLSRVCIKYGRYAGY